MEMDAGLTGCLPGEDVGAGGLCERVWVVGGGEVGGGVGGRGCDADPFERS